MKIPFGKFKDQEDIDVAKTEKGRSWMAWVIDQPVEEGKYKERNIERNERWRKLLAETAPKPKTAPKEEKVSSAVQEVNTMILLEHLKVIEVQLDIINKNVMKLLITEGWDKEEE